MTSIEISAKKNIEKLFSQLKNIYKLSIIVRKSYNFEFVVSDQISSVKLQIYFGKSGEKLVIQGNKDTQLYRKLHQFVFEEKSIVENVQQPILEPDFYIGTDESGKGDVFGPLVIAGVCVNAELIAQLKKNGVKDSKELNDKNIGELANFIKTIPNLDFFIYKIIPQEYNELYLKFNNLNLLLEYGHKIVLENLVKRNKCTEIIVDKFMNSGFKNNEISGLKCRINQYTKAERFMAVAAASILARNEFNLWFVEKEKAGLNLLKGASSIVDKRINEISQKHNKEIFNKIAKLHFKNLTRVL